MWIKINERYGSFYNEYSAPKICIDFNLMIDYVGKTIMFQGNKYNTKIIYKYNTKIIWFLVKPLFSNYEIINRYYTICG